MNSIKLVLKYLNSHKDLSMAVGVVFLIMMIIVPMPTIVLDLLLACNILLSVMIVLNVLYIKSALEFTVFPSILLMSTVFSLALNISSTRLILTQGENFQGSIIRSFGSFVVGTSGSEGLVVGAIIFVIIIAVQFIVITKGSTRIAEVAAKFRLDALPGKQMGIEAEFNSGSITEEEHNIKKAELQQEVDFYGSMDGASKFVSGNIKAGIFITFINIVGGLVVGVLIRNENFATALSNYVQLTIGDGLVSQLPALLISTATGIIVTRAVSTEGNLTDDIVKEFTNYERIYLIAGVFLCVIGLLPGFPWYLLFPMGGLLIASAIIKTKSKSTEEEKIQKERESTAQSQVVAPKLEPLDPISLEVGYDLVPLVQDDEGRAELLNRVSSIRKELGVKYGIIIPLVRIVDSVLLNPSEYSIKMNGVEVSKGSIMVNKLLAIHSQGSSDIELEGDITTDPAFGLPAVWIHPNERGKAERAGYTVADPTSVISTHISSTLESHASEILSRQDVASMLDQYKETHPVTIDEVRKHLEIGKIQHVFRRLLRERISLRNLTTIFETLGDYGALTKDIDLLVEKCRQALSRQITKQYVDENNALYAYNLDQKIERMIADIVSKSSESRVNMLAPNIREQLLLAIAKTVRPVQIEGTDGIGKSSVQTKSPVLITSELVRPIIYKLLSESLNKKQYSIPILSIHDIDDDCTVEYVGTVILENMANQEKNENQNKEQLETV